jgi:hypothetical protein
MSLNQFWAKFLIISIVSHVAMQLLQFLKRVIYLEEWNVATVLGLCRITLIVACCLAISLKITAVGHQFLGKGFFSHIY